MNIMEMLNRSLIAVDAYTKAHRTLSKENTGNVLLVFQQAFGDAIVLQNSLDEYIKLFSKNEGYNITLILQPSVLKFMRKCLPLPSEIKYESVDFKLFLSNYAYYRKTVKKYRNNYSTVIVPGASLSGEIFAAASGAQRKIGLVRSIPVHKPFVMSIFPKIAFTERVTPNKEDMMLMRHKKLINYLWKVKTGKQGNYKAELPQLIPKKRIIDGHYAVICPGASKSEKCWPIDRFAEIANYLISEYNLEVNICGGSGEKHFANILMENTRYKEKIISHIGKTSFSEWSAIVQHADLVVGNDSATMHLAAAARVPAVCITGVYDKYQFFPYQVDRLNPGDILPVTVMKDVPCEWCRTIGYDAGYGNKDCKKRIKSGLCAACIDLITVDEVESAIDKLMENVKIEAT